MENRVEKYLKPPRALEFCVIRARSYKMEVTRAEAQRVLAVLRMRRRPRWIRVMDISGAQIWVMTKSIEFIAECTQEWRENNRRFYKQLDEEEEENEGY